MSRIKPLTQKELDVNPTQQSFKNDVDVNTIVKKYKAGIVPQGTTKTPLYGDFTSGQHLHDAMLQVNEAKDQFMELDPKVRAFFKNSPVKLLEFLDDSKNKDKAIELGLIEGETPDPLKGVMDAIEKKYLSEDTTKN